MEEIEKNKIRKKLVKEIELYEYKIQLAQLKLKQLDDQSLKDIVIDKPIKKRRYCKFY
jgi:hypothetical protein